MYIGKKKGGLSTPYKSPDEAFSVLSHTMP